MIIKEIYNCQWLYYGILINAERKSIETASSDGIILCIVDGDAAVPHLH